MQIPIEKHHQLSSIAHKTKNKYSITRFQIRTWYNNIIFYETNRKKHEIYEIS